jgi:hypothetical protein
VAELCSTGCHSYELPSSHRPEKSNPNPHRTGTYETTLPLALKLQTSLSKHSLESDEKRLAPIRISAWPVVIHSDSRRERIMLPMLFDAEMLVIYAISVMSGAMFLFVAAREPRL